MRSAFVLGGRGISVGRDALDWARRAGVEGVELWTVDNDFDPRTLTSTGRQDLAHALIRAGLACAALCNDLGGFHDPATVDERVARTLAAIDLARELASGSVVVSADTIPENHKGPAYRGLGEALQTVAAHAADRGVGLAVTSIAAHDVLLPLLGGAAGRGAELAFDPAAQFRAGRTPLEVLEPVAHWVRHVYWRDADRREGDDDWIYNEVRAGTGKAGLADCLALLAEAGYDRYVAIDRVRDAGRADELIAGLRHFESVRRDLRDAARHREER